MYMGGSQLVSSTMSYLISQLFLVLFPIVPHLGSRDTSVIAKLFKPDESNDSDEEEKDYYFSNSFSDES